jgi:hypothetical protein
MEMMKNNAERERERGQEKRNEELKRKPKKGLV